MLRLLGDVHGDLTPVAAAVAKRDHREFGPVVQMGDFGFADTYRKLHRYDKEQLRILGGNHDEYPELVKCPHYLGDYGLLPGHSDVFFIRGALSIDKHWRIEGRDWWQMEQLHSGQWLAVAELYEANKPRVVISHDAPDQIVEMMYGRKNRFPSATGKWLAALLCMHAPVSWYFAHHHVSWETDYRGCHFRCININEYAEVEANLRFTTGETTKA